MSLEIPSEIKQFLLVLRKSYFNESVFKENINHSLTNLEEHGLPLSIKVELNDVQIAQFGRVNLSKVWKSATLRFGNIECQIIAEKTTDEAAAEELWDPIVEVLKKSLAEHYNDRSGDAGVWKRNEESAKRKCSESVKRALVNNKKVAYVLLDVDGFGTAKTKLPTERDADALMARIASFFRENISMHALLFHPHGDEFEFIFIDSTEECVLDILHKFQNDFARHDFKRGENEAAIHLSVKMTIAFSHERMNHEIDPLSVMMETAQKVDFKKIKQRRFIHISGDKPETNGALKRDLLHHAIFDAYRGLDSEKVCHYGEGIQNQIANWLVSEADGADLNTALDELLMNFRIEVVSDGDFDSTNSICGRYIHTARLASILLHILLKRRFNGKGPANPNQKLAIRIENNDNKWTLAICEKDATGAMKDLVKCSNVVASAPLCIEAGYPWMPLLDGEGAGVRRYKMPAFSDAPNRNSPCLIICVGSANEYINENMRRWVAGLACIDDRPVTAGKLPDFWQSNIARIIGMVLENPNIRTIILVCRNRESIGLTRMYLRGASIAPQDTEAAEWLGDRISYIAQSTSLIEPDLRAFKDRKLKIVEVDAEMKEVENAVLSELTIDPAHITAVGERRKIEWPEAYPGDGDCPKPSFLASSLSDVYPCVLRALRHARVPRFTEPDGREIAELYSVRIELINPIVEVPRYWMHSDEQFKQYYRRAFEGVSSLFGARFYSWGAKDGGKGEDQVDSAITRTVEAIRANKVVRRIMIATSEPPGKEPDPLGLTTIHIMPRLIDSNWRIDIIWQWRSVEAIVGFPFSVYGTIRFSEEFVAKVRAKLAHNTDVRLGTVIYSAVSLHLFCDNADRAIARMIDLGSRK